MIKYNLLNITYSWMHGGREGGRDRQRDGQITEWVVTAGLLAGWKGGSTY